MPDDQQHFHAYEIHQQTDMPVEPAPHDRAWMDATDRRFAYRCLPLVVANQCGWIIRSPNQVTIRWNGGAAITDLEISFPEGVEENRIMTHFGEGILTFTVPYLFRTPPGINLWVKGPANAIKDGVQPLEGIVEADWAESTFTMNWKVTRANHPIVFEQGEPICMLVPIPRELTSSLIPIRQKLSDNPELDQRFQKWSASRKQFNEALEGGDPEVAKLGWQRDYMLGRQIDGEHFPQHQTKLQVRPFRHDS